MTANHPGAPLVAVRTQERLERDISHMPRTTSALLFHTTERELAMVTAHPVDHDDSGLPHIGPGRPLTPTDERRLLDLLQGKAAETIEILPANVLAKAPGMLMWWMPPAPRKMLMKPRDAGLGTEISAHWPGLVLLVLGRTLFVTAVKGPERPTGDSALFHGPFPNLFADGRVCTGSARLPSDCSLTEIGNWERVLLDSYWTHDNHPDVLAAPKRRKKSAALDNYQANDFWMARAGSAEPFPESRLVTLGMRLADWPTYLAGGDARRRAR